MTCTGISSKQINLKMSQDNYQDKCALSITHIKQNKIPKESSAQMCACTSVAANVVVAGCVVTDINVFILCKC